MINELGNYTTSTAFLEALQEAGVSYLFSNLGSDHPAIIEALAKAEQDNKEMPKVIMCPHEMVALSAAHGYAQMTGEPQAVLVHVECGTQNLGAAIHNAWKGRVPVLIFAGMSPYSQEGEELGSRNEFIHWIQDVPDQRGIVRGYMKYENEIRTGSNVKQLVHRALQIAKTHPQGPVYLTGTREVMERETDRVEINKQLWEPVAPRAIDPQSVDTLINDLLKAKNPLIVTSYIGKSKKAVEELIKLSETVAIPVLESVPNYMNFPANNELHVGYQWNTSEQNELLSQADFILVIDSDVPWIQLKNKPSDDATIYYIDEDPLKESMSLWYIPSKRFFAAESEVALNQLNLALKKQYIDQEKIEKRRNKIRKIHESKRAVQYRLEEINDNDFITPEYLLACIRDLSDDQTIILNELISNYDASYTHLNRTKPGSILGSGAGGLGWNGGAAIGAKLADPSKTVINLTGDGTYMFSVPSSVYWMARKYDAPILTIIFNNRGWKSPKLSTLALHPDGFAHENELFHVDFTPHADLSKIAEAAGGAYACKIEKASDLKVELEEALKRVRAGQSAVLDVQLSKGV